MNGLITAAKSRQFTPLKIPNCDVWLRSDLGITLATGVSTWANQGNVGAAGNATQVTTALQPLYSQTGGLNGRPSLTFDGSKDFNWAYAKTGARTIMVVLKLRATAGSGYTIYEIITAGTYAEMIVDLNTYQPVSYIDDWPSGGGGNMVGDADSLGTTNGHVLIHTSTASAIGVAGNYTATFDGYAKTVVASGAYGGTDGASLIGSRNASFTANMDLYEIAVFSRILTAQEMLDLGGYAKALYRI